MVNRYAGKCEKCGNHVPAQGGTVRKVGRMWVVRHLACESAGTPQVMEFRFSSGATMIRNVRGTCEDAPCCGCCTF